MMQKKSSKSNKVSLEEAIRLVNGGEILSDESASALEAAVGVARSACNVVEVQHTPPIEPAELLQEALPDLGRCAARLIPEDRLVAQRLISVGLEMLVSGGSVMPAHVSDQLGPFVGLHEANSLRRLPNRGDAEVEAWRKVVSQPLEGFLSFLLKRGLLESQCGIDGETCQATQEALPCLAAVWRYVDPASNRCGFEDALRRAVNRFQRTRRSFSFGGSSSSLDVSASLANVSSAVQRCSLPAMSAVEQPLTSTSSLRSPSCGSRQPSKEVFARSTSKTRLGSRSSTPGSVASSNGLTDMAFQSSRSNCSTATSDCQHQPPAKNYILLATGNRLMSPKH